MRRRPIDQQSSRGLDQISVRIVSDLAEALPDFARPHRVFWPCKAMAFRLNGRVEVTITGPMLSEVTGQPHRVNLGEWSTLGRDQRDWPALAERVLNLFYRTERLALVMQATQGLSKDSS